MSAATIPTPTSGSDVIQTSLINEQYRIGTGIWSYLLGTSCWAKLINRGTWPDGLGSSISTLNFERALIGTTTGKGTWANHTALGASSVATGSSPPDISTSRGLPPVGVVQATQRVRTYNLLWTAVESVRINVSDARFSWQFKEQISSMYELLQDATKRVWTYQVREEYFRLADYKVLPGVPESGATNTLADLTVTGPSSFATLTGYSLAQLNATGGTPSGGFSTNHSVLTGGVLRAIYPVLNRQGAGIAANMKAGGKPVYPLVCSLETSEGLKREPGARSDIRFAEMGKGGASDLLKPMGYDESLCGFTHVIDDEVPRFTLAVNSGLYDFTEVSPWSYQAGSISTAVASATSTGAPSGCYIATVTSSAGLVAGQIVTITASTASDEEVQGQRRVRSVPSTTTVIIEDAAFTDTYAGTMAGYATNGQGGWVPNTSYDTAPYELSYILHPEAMEILTTDSLTTLGSTTEFDPTTSIGNFRWTNIRHEVNNPDGTMGYFRAVLEEASKPMKTKFAWCILHRRPDPTFLAAPGTFAVSGLGYTA